MPAKGYLKPEQKEKLQKALKEEENAEIRERILILLLLNDGKTQAAISEFLEHRFSNQPAESMYYSLM